MKIFGEDLTFYDRGPGMRGTGLNNQERTTSKIYRWVRSVIHQIGKPLKT